MTSTTRTNWELQHDWPLPAWALVFLIIATFAFLAWPMIGESMRWQRKAGLFGLRALAVALIFWMLGGWQLSFFETDLPDLLLIVDDSMSMQLPVGDSAADLGINRLEFAKRLIAENHWDDELSERYRVSTFSIGEQLQFVNRFDELKADEAASRLGNGLLELANRQRGRSTAAIVMVSDGIVTDGASLRDAADRLAAQNIPVWTIGLGSDTQPPEIAIDEIVADDRAFLGDEVRVGALLRGGAPISVNATVELRDRDSDALLGSAPVRIDSQQMRATVALRFPANRPGLWNLEVVVSPIEGEIFTENNRKSLSVLVRDDPIGVLLIGQQPSYEFRFLKHLLERAKGQGRASENLIQLTSVLQDGDPRYAEQDRSAASLPPVKRSELESLDVIILCDADATQLGESMLQQIAELVRTQGLGLVFIAGPNHGLSVSEISVVSDLLPVAPSKTHQPAGLQERPLPIDLTRLARASGELPLPAGMAWRQMPAIYWLMKTDVLKDTAQVLLATDRQSPNDSQEPVVVTQMVGAGQVWLQLTDESFRWLNASANHNLHERYWLQVIRQLARRKQTAKIDRPELMVSGKRFTQSQPVEIGLKLPESLKLRQARIELQSTKGDTRIETLTASDDERLLRTSIQDLAAGEYTIRLVDPVLPQSPDIISLRIESPSVEFSSGAAALAELDQISKLTGGELLSPAQAEHSLLQRLPAGRTIRLNELPSRSIWNHWVIAAMVVGLLSSEWILRRRWGLP